MYTHTDYLLVIWALQKQNKTAPYPHSSPAESRKKGKEIQEGMYITIVEVLYLSQSAKGRHTSCQYLSSGVLQGGGGSIVGIATYMQKQCYKRWQRKKTIETYTCGHISDGVQEFSHLLPPALLLPGGKMFSPIVRE